MVIGLIGAAGGAVLDTAMGPLITAMDKLTETVRESFQFADRAQKASLALGVSYEQTSESLGSTMKGLRGDISQKFQAGIAGMEVGLQGNTAGIAKLINQQMLTGTQYQQTAKAFATLETGLDLSRQDTNNLAASFKLIGNKWEISTDKLVTAMDGLKDTLPSQRLAGMGSGMTQAMMETLGSLGPQLMPEFNKVMRAIFDPTVEGAGVLMRLGIGNIRERLGQERDTLVRSKMLMDAIEIAGGRYNKMAEGADKAFFMIDKANQAYGKSGIHFSTLAAALGDRLERSGHDIADYWNTAKNLFKEMFAGFQEGITKAYPFFLEGLKTVSAIVSTLGVRFNNFAESLGGEGGAASAMYAFKLALFDIAISGLWKMEGVFEFLKNFVTQVVPWIWSTLMDSIFELTKTGGIFDSFSAGLAMATRALVAIPAEFGKDWAKAAQAKAIDKMNMHDINAQDLAHAKVAGISAAATEAFLSSRQAGWAQQGGYRTGMGLTSTGNDKFPGQGLKEFAKLWEEDQAKLGLGGKVGAMWKGAADLAFAEGAERKSPIYHELVAMRDATKEGFALNHEDHEENRREKNSLEFLESSANVFGGTVRDILGLDEGSTIADLYKLLLEANEQRDAISILNRLDAYGN